jgi:hypothetical protein
MCLVDGPTLDVIVDPLYCDRLDISTGKNMPFHSIYLLRTLIIYFRTSCRTKFAFVGLVVIRLFSSYITYLDPWWRMVSLLIWEIYDSYT